MIEVGNCVAVVLVCGKLVESTEPDLCLSGCGTYITAAAVEDRPPSDTVACDISGLCYEMSLVVSHNLVLSRPRLFCERDSILCSHAATDQSRNVSWKMSTSIYMSLQS